MRRVSNLLCLWWLLLLLLLLLLLWIVIPSATILGVCSGTSTVLVLSATTTTGLPAAVVKRAVFGLRVDGRQFESRCRRSGSGGRCDSVRTELGR